MSNCDDGLIDAIQGSTAITISNCHFSPIITRVWFKGCQDVDTGLFMLSTMTTLIGSCMLAIGGSQHPTILSQGNRFIASPEAACKELSTLQAMALKNILKNPHIKCMHCHMHSEGDMINAKPGTFEVSLTDFAGCLNSISESEWRSWYWSSKGDLMLNGAFFFQSRGPIRNMHKEDMINVKPKTFEVSLTDFAGHLKCDGHKLC
ncbi:pectate lyase [Quercus suber]|uniref:Pectate lyase n=1 Tax=Quercus suber TaxID=58331 RepID=A0AAW0KET8_QUESU